MELSDYRARIDQIDRQLVELFAQRMNTAAGIAAYKKEHGLPVLDPVREREKLLDVAAQAPEDMRDYTASLYTMLFELSRCYQGRLLGSTSPLTTEIQTAIDQTPNLFPSNVSVACQGVAGAYSQLACDNKNQQRVQGKFQQRADKFRHSDLHPRPLEGMAGHL